MKTSTLLEVTDWIITVTIIGSAFYLAAIYANSGVVYFVLTVGAFIWIAIKVIVRRQVRNRRD
jgi:hypothetical protein